MKVLPFRNRGFSQKWSLDEIKAPWGDRQAIYDHVVAHVQPTGLADGWELLPDDTDFFAGGTRWAPGSLDGPAENHPPAEEDPAETAAWLSGQLVSLLREMGQEKVDAFYATVKASTTLDYVDELVELFLADASVAELERLHRFASWLATKSSDREPVKLAIALLGIADGGDRPATMEMVRTLGRHDELTLFAAFSLVNLAEVPDIALWELARQVHGWGRIHLVERLADMTVNDDIMDWMLREGYRNDVLYEYLAHICATAGGLDDALADEEVDDALLEGAGDILRTLIDGIGGPAEGMDEYEEGAVAASLYLEHVLEHEGTVTQLLAVQAIKRYLEDTDADWEAQATMGWSEDARESLAESVAEILKTPDWEEKVRAGLGAPPGREFLHAAQAADALGIDPWEHYFKHLQNGAGYWVQALQTKDLERVDQVLELAGSVLPLDGIVQGKVPAPNDKALEAILLELRHFPGHGWNVIKAGLKSQWVRDRQAAVRALGVWKLSDWPEQAKFLVRKARADEGNLEVRKAFDDLFVDRGF